ncbi:2-dehydropantoate 2-reductase [Pedobacter cryoconitis]|uniref:2-dehydropantoate 2-reductase n=1 Tax=Pedobacter cryoconitis TaxID=188932 RepID=UPI00161FFD02|nr:2-dehydropantoate 2-reductase [Pedobacter cryoconitis]MBB5645107.1 2-dehydropantoate 2-reductase [Pedobacter cryoconitis]
MINKKLKISIVGTGAIGGYYGILLSQMGHDVHFLLRSDYDYVKSNGLTLQSVVHGNIHLPEINAYNDASDMPVSDIVLVCLKTGQNKTILPKVLPHITNENTVVVLIQNGLGMEEDLSAEFPFLQIAGATALVGIHKEKNGLIVHEGYGNIDFGNYSVRENTMLEYLASIFNSINIPSSCQDLLQLRWKKLVWNMAFNGLSVVLNSTTAQIITNHFDYCRTIMHEVIKGANANGIELPLSFADELIIFTEKIKDYSPSMKYDFDRSQPLELQYMYQKPIAAAKEAGYEMIKTTNLYNELSEISMTTR